MALIGLTKGRGRRERCLGGEEALFWEGGFEVIKALADGKEVVGV